VRKHSQTNKCQGSLYLHAGIPSSLPQFNVQPLKANMHCILPGVLHPTLSFRGRASRWHGSRCVTDGAGCDAACRWQSNTSDNLRKISCCDCCRGAYISGAVATGKVICVSLCQAPMTISFRPIEVGSAVGQLRFQPIGRPSSQAIERWKCSRPTALPTSIGRELIVIGRTTEYPAY